MRVVDFGDGDLKMMLEAARNMGRGGDTELVHINKAEEKILKEAGGSGTVNPKTGLKEFYTPEGGAGKSQDTGGKSTGAKGDFGGGKGGFGGDKDGNKSSGGRAIDNPLVRGAGGFMSPTGKLGQRADVKAATGGRGLSDAEANDLSRDWADRVSGIGGMEIDPLGIGLSLLGAINPALGLLGLGYNALKGTGVIEGTSTTIGAPSYRSVADLVADRAGIGTASGSRSGGNNRNGEAGGKGRTTGKLRTTPFPTAPGPATPATPGTPTTKPAEKSPADVLLDRYKLPGINAPFDLAPYTIDRTQHQKLVSDALASRGGV